MPVQKVTILRLKCACTASCGTSAKQCFTQLTAVTRRGTTFLPGRGSAPAGNGGSESSCRGLGPRLGAPRRATLVLSTRTTAGSAGAGVGGASRDNRRSAAGHRQGPERRPPLHSIILLVVCLFGPSNGPTVKPTRPIKSPNLAHVNEVG